MRISRGEIQEELARLGMKANMHSSRLESGVQSTNIYMVFRLAENLKIKASKVIMMEFDSSNPNTSQALSLNILGSLAEFERHMMRETTCGHPSRPST